MENEKNLEKELKQIKLLLALNLIKDLQTKTEKIVFLSKAGIEIAEIARILETTTNTVSVTVYQSKNPKSKKRSDLAKVNLGGEQLNMQENPK
jgi:chromosome segregation and condensation protein ScpB